MARKSVSSIRDHWLLVRVAIFVIVAVAAILNFPVYGETVKPTPVRMRDDCGLYLAKMNFRKPIKFGEEELSELKLIVAQVFSPVPRTAYDIARAIVGASERMEMIQGELDTIWKDTPQAVLDSGEKVNEIQFLKDQHLRLTSSLVVLNHQLSKIIGRGVLH